MATQIKYINNIGVEVSLAQVQDLDGFIKQHVIDGVLFKEEIFKKKPIDWHIILCELSIADSKHITNRS